MKNGKHKNKGESFMKTAGDPNSEKINRSFQGKKL
jgi:hypothetical protein